MAELAKKRVGEGAQESWWQSYGTMPVDCRRGPFGGLVVAGASTAKG